MALLRGDMVSALAWNPGLIIGSVLFVVYVAWGFWRERKDGLWP